MQYVEVWVGISGDYASWNEMSISVKYDITNNIQLGYMTLEELEEWEYDANYSDYTIKRAILHNGIYYIET